MRVDKSVIVLFRQMNLFLNRELLDEKLTSIFDGKVRTLDEAVPFFIGGTITMLPDGTASIQITDGS